MQVESRGRHHSQMRCFAIARMVTTADGVEIVSRPDQEERRSWLKEFSSLSTGVLGADSFYLSKGPDLFYRSAPTENHKSVDLHTEVDVSGGEMSSPLEHARLRTS